jgi:hypothetical protein
MIALTSPQGERLEVNVSMSAEAEHGKSIGGKIFGKHQNSM